MVRKVKAEVGAEGAETAAEMMIETAHTMVATALMLMVKVS